MNLDAAQETFVKFLAEVSEEDRARFLIWANRSYFTSMCRGDRPAVARMRLREISTDIKELIPFNGVLSSESFVAPTTGENADYDAKTTVHLDAFLYSDADLDELEEEGKLDRNYCLDCFSHRVAPLTFISHSTSVQRMDFIFGSFLPYLKDKVVVDVGSRLGAILYGAYVFTPASKIIGIEFNKELCDIQTKMVEKHNMTDRIQVICDDVQNQASVVASADVIFLNNVFEFFLDEENQVKAWQFLKENIKKGAIILSIPSLEKALQNLKVNFELDSWVKLRPITDPLTVLNMETQPEIAEICTYDVL